MQLISLKIYLIADIILGNCVFKNSGTSLLSCLVSSAQCLSPSPSTCPWPGAPCKSWCQLEQLALHLSQLIILLKETNEVHVRVLVSIPVLLLLPGGVVISHVAQVAASQPSHHSMLQHLSARVGSSFSLTPRHWTPSTQAQSMWWREICSSSIISWSLVVTTLWWREMQYSATSYLGGMNTTQWCLTILKSFFSINIWMTSKS